MRKNTMVLTAGMLMVGVVSNAQADIYKYVDQQGIAHFTNRPSGSHYKLVLKTKKARPRRKAKDGSSFAERRRQFAQLIESIAFKYRLDKALVHAIITIESGYNPNAVSHKGAAGLMQLMPATARRYGVSDIHDPGQNLEGGIRYLRDLLFRFDTLNLALAAYNAGEAAVIKHGNDVPPYPETQNYVRKVLAHYQKYRKPS